MQVNMQKIIILVIITVNDNLLFVAIVALCATDFTPKEFY
jgi:hypothetical protein